ncbi:MAG: hypothetical protein V4492_02345 [Chlamydiota bacterium]
MQKSLFKQLGLSLLASTLLISATPIPVEAPLVLEMAQERLSSVGRLLIAPDGLVYVKVSDHYIHEALKILNDPAIERPPYFGEGKIGAHITAFTIEESKSRDLFLPQLEQPIVFAVTDFDAVEVEGKRIYYYKVDVPQVELIRMSNGLPPKIVNHDFHITVGIRTLEVDAGAQR